MVGNWVEEVKVKELKLEIHEIEDLREGKNRDGKKLKPRPLKCDI